MASLESRAWGSAFPQGLPGDLGMPSSGYLTCKNTAVKKHKLTPCPSVAWISCPVLAVCGAEPCRERFLHFTECAEYLLVSGTVVGTGDRMMDETDQGPAYTACSLVALSQKESVLVCGFPGGAVVKNSPANGRDRGSSPSPGRSHMSWSN